VCAGFRGINVAVPGDRELADLARRGARARGLVPGRPELRVGLDGDHHLRFRCERRDRLRAADRDRDRNARWWQVPELGRVHPVVVADVVDVAPGEEGIDDVQGFFQAFVALVGPRPTSADHMLVEVFTRTEAEGEPTIGQQPHGRRLLGDDRGVVATGRTGHVGHQFKLVGGLTGCSEHGPGVRAVPLLVEPRGEVVTDHRESESGLLGCGRVADQLCRAGLLAHQGVSDAHHEPRLASRNMICILYRARPVRP
jgi:hypothetical protein